MRTARLVFAAALMVMLAMAPIGATASLVVDHLANEFIIGFLPTIQPGPEPVLHVYMEYGDTILVEWPMNAPIISDTVVLGPGASASITLPPGASGDWTPGIGQNAVRISAIGGDVADHRFACYLATTTDSTAAAALALPYVTLGNEYVVTNFTAPDIGFADAGQFLVIGTRHGTTVEITPTQDLASGQLAGTPFIVNLNEGDAFYGQSAAVSGAEVDLTGTYINATREVAVMNGNRCAVIPGNTVKCGHLFEMALPVRFWDDHVLVANPPLRDSGSFFTVVSYVDNNTVTVPGVMTAVINAHQALSLGPLTGDYLISGTGQIQVTQFVTSSDAPGVGTGGAEMNHVMPLSLHGRETYFLTGFGAGSETSLVTIYVENDDVGLAYLDGVAIDSAAYSPIGTSGFSVARVGVLPGPHWTRVHLWGKHSVVVHEFEVDGHTYGYPAGFYYQEESCLITIAGDVDESGSITSADIIYLVGYVFKGGIPPSPCAANGDVNCSATITSSDIIYLVGHVFRGQPGPCDICNESPLPCF